MMSDPTTVDRITVDEETGKLVLLIEEGRPWREPDLMHRQLAAKVKHYVRYIRSKEFAAQHGRTPEETLVRLVCVDQPGASTRKFFERVGYELSKHGIGFQHRIAGAGRRGRTPRTAPPSPAAPPSNRTGTGGAGGGAPQQPSAPGAGGEERPHSPETPASPAAERPESTTPTGGGGEAAGGQGDEPGVSSAPPPPATGTPAQDEPGPEPPAAPEPPDSAPAMPPGDRETPGPTADEPDATGPAVPQGSGAGGEPAELHEEETPTPPSIFPEEEFGRAPPEWGEWEEDTEEAEQIVVESGTGKRTVLSGTPKASRTQTEASGRKKDRVIDVEQPSILRALRATLSGLIAAIVVWPLVAAAVGHSASPVAIGIGIMEGLGVRLLGAGHSFAYRLIAIVGTVVACLAGTLLVAGTLTALASGAGLGGILTVLSTPEGAIGAVTHTFGWFDLLSYALGLYLAFRIAASKEAAT